MMFRFRSYLLSACIALYYLHQILHTYAFEEKYSNRYYDKSDGGYKMRNSPEFGIHPEICSQAFTMKARSRGRGLFVQKTMRSRTVCDFLPG